MVPRWWSVVCSSRSEEEHSRRELQWSVRESTRDNIILRVRAAMAVANCAAWGCFFRTEERCICLSFFKTTEQIDM